MTIPALDGHGQWPEALPTLIGTRADGTPFDPLTEYTPNPMDWAGDAMERERPRLRAGIDGGRPFDGYVTFFDFNRQPLHELFDQAQQDALDEAERQGPWSRCQSILWAMICVAIAYVTLGRTQDVGPKGF